MSQTLVRTSSAPGRNGYRAVLSTRPIPRLLAGTLLGRLPSAMAPTLVLLAVVAQGGGFARAGALSALQSAAASTGQPLLARLAERRGTRLVLASATAAASGALLALAVTGTRVLPAAAVLVTLSGLCAPPLQSCLRSAWPRLLPDLDTQRTALALDTASAEALYIGAPLLSAAAVFALSPAAGFAAAAAAGIAGSAIVLRVPSPRPVADTRRGGLLGPLRTPVLLALLPAHLGLGVAIGTLPLAAVVIAGDSHRVALTGVLPGAFFLASVLGAVLYGARSRRGSPRAHLLVLTGAFTGCWSVLPLPAVATRPPLALAAVLAPGLWLAATLAAGQLVLLSAVPPHVRAEASAWSIAALGFGEAAGAAACGATARTLDPTLWPLLGALLALMALLLTFPALRPSGRALIEP